MPARISAWAIYDVFDTKDDDKVFVGVLTIVAAGLVLTGLLRRLEQRLDAWRPPAELQTKGAGA